MPTSCSISTGERYRLTGDVVGMNPAGHHEYSIRLLPGAVVEVTGCPCADSAQLAEVLYEKNRFDVFGRYLEENATKITSVAPAPGPLKQNAPNRWRDHCRAIIKHRVSPLKTHHSS